MSKNIQFTVREILVLTMLASLGVGWYASLRREELLKLRNEQHNSRYSDALLQIRLLESRLQRPETPPEESSNVVAGLLAQTNIDGSSLKGATLIGSDFAFSELSIREGNLTGAALQGGDSSFQRAVFDNAVAKEARLSSGIGAFSEASFNNADLTGATLMGNGTSFQGSSFKNAKLIRAKFVVTSTTSFEAANIGGAQFQGADLTSISSQALKICFFETPPRYDHSTRFPNGFDPKVEGWQKDE